MKKNVFTLEIFLSFRKSLSEREKLSILPPSTRNHSTTTIYFHAIIADPIERHKPSTDRSECFWKYLFYFSSPRRRLKTCTSNTTTREILKWDLNEKALEYHFCVPNCLRVSVASARFRDHKHSRSKNSRLCVVAPTLLQAAPIGNEEISSLLSVCRWHKYSDAWVIRTLIDRDPIEFRRISLAFTSIKCKFSAASSSN